MAEFKTITQEELKKWIDEEKDFTLIDVLSENSYEGKHIPTALNADIHRHDFLEYIHTIAPDKSKEIVVYCASNTCQFSPTAARKLSEDGYTSVYHYPGGIAEWQNSKLQFEEGSK